MAFLIIVVVPVLMFLTVGMLKAPAATFRFVGMFLLVCFGLALLLGGLAGVATGGLYLVFGFV